KSDNPEPGGRPSDENVQANQDTEDTRDQQQPPRLCPIANAYIGSSDAGGDEYDTQYPGQGQRASRRLREQDEPDHDVGNAKENLPNESAPSLRPEGMDDLEGAGRNRHGANKERADQRRNCQITENEDA